MAIQIGKSTLLKIIAGALVPDEGDVRIGDTVDLGWIDQHRDMDEVSIPLRLFAYLFLIDSAHRKRLFSKRSRKAPLSFTLVRTHCRRVSLFRRSTLKEEIRTNWFIS